MARKTLTASIAALLLATTLPLGSIAEDVTERHVTETHICCGGVIPESDEIVSKHIVTTEKLEKDGVVLRSSYPSQVDLSTSPFFPPIGNQGTIGSCAAFSTVYYQFTYEANKLNDITTTAENAYSPKQIYYYLCENTSNSGVRTSNVYSFLEDFGALRMEDDPYVSQFDSSCPLYSDTTKMREALNTRLADYTTIKIDFASKITNPRSSNLNEVKAYLNSGKILRISTYLSFDIGVSGDGPVIYRCKVDENRGHSMVIVGYDDSKSLDVNGNGTIEECEKGAFKIANSYGSEYGNEGYIWVLYDALNSATTIPGDWEKSLNGTRAAVCAAGLPYNAFDAIVVCNYKVDYVAELNFQNVKRNNVYFYMQKEKNGVTKRNLVTAPKTPIVSSFTLVFDYFKVCSGVEADNCDFSLGVDLTGVAKNLSSGKITDNRGNKIADLSSVANQEGSYRAPIDLIRGDVNYNGTITNADVILVTRYCSGWDNLSNIQIYLADYNGDGKVTNTDVILMQRYIANNS